MDINRNLDQELYKLIDRQTYTCIRCQVTVLIEYVAAHAAVCSPSTRMAQALLTMNAAGEVLEDSQ